MAINSQLKGLILEYFGFQPTPEQEKAAEMMADFMFEQTRDEIFLLRGYAGTGKTSLVGALVRCLDALQQRTVLMAPTGRAAKVFSLHAHHTAYTIHKRIYRQKTFTGDMADFMQNVNLLKHTLFIVDEASMISNEGLGGSMFGTGHLLDDLIQFVYSGEGCRLMLVGDTAQLPPVGEELSPALEPDFLAGYGMKIYDITLTQVVRQLTDSGILWNATMLRSLIANDEVWALPKLRLQGFPDVRYLPGNELIEELEQAYYQCGTDQTIVITRSNVRANAFNQGIRSRILGYEEELAGGDQLMIVKNNYHWVKPEGIEEPDSTQMDFIANFPDYENMEVEATAILDTLTSEAPALTRQQQETLFQHVWDDYPECHNKRDRMKAVKEDPFFNALQIKYAYAVTCHKAQGGQWQRVFIDQGYMPRKPCICSTGQRMRWMWRVLTD